MSELWFCFLFCKVFGMSKKDKNNKEKESKNIENNEDTSSDDGGLEDILKEAKQLEKKELIEEIESLKKENKKLEKQVSKLQDFEEIAKKAQSQYAMIKSEFDSYQTRIEKQKEKNKDKEFIKIVKKVLPMYDNLRLSMLNVPDDLEDNEWVQGVSLSIKNMENKLKDMWVYPIDSVWELPHHDYHEPISTKEVEDEEDEGKILEEVEKGYVYKSKDSKDNQVIRPAKVVVGK